MADERHRLVFMAKVTEQAERYNDMAEYMKTLAMKLPLDFPDTTEEYKAAKENGTSTEILLDDERNLLSVAYKNIVGSRRNAWRVLESSEHGQQCKLDNGQTQAKDLQITEKIKICKECKTVVEGELNAICDEVTELLDNYLIKNADAGGAESKVFYLKMKGDYFRYKVEVASAENREELSLKSEEAYEKAWNTATSSLKPTHPIRLGLALNFSVFYYEIRNEPQKARELAKDAFDKGIQDMGDDKEQSNTYKDSTLIMQLLRDNLALWTSESGENDDQQVEDEN
ncbi:14-3-3 protein gamma-like [Pecten maximus]|uniref:14-3-3 protein gamma-like n=1 Tax=Pecten maximus TaxID=6579 RepID=UPI0014582610|nr:14-3-3 protein gamma-like [Pecten maximus]